MSSISGGSLTGRITNALSINVTLPLENHLDITANIAIPFSSSSRQVSYDNTGTTLQSRNVQDAITELDQKIVTYDPRGNAVYTGIVEPTDQEDGDLWFDTN